jgi:hypothetical protein
MPGRIAISIFIPIILSMFGCVVHHQSRSLDAEQTVSDDGRHVVEVSGNVPIAGDPVDLSGLLASIAPPTYWNLRSTSSAEWLPDGQVESSIANVGHETFVCSFRPDGAGPTEYRRSNVRPGEELVLYSGATEGLVLPSMLTLPRDVTQVVDIRFKIILGFSEKPHYMPKWTVSYVLAP